MKREKEDAGARANRKAAQRSRKINARLAGTVRRAAEASQELNQSPMSGRARRG